ncbi:MAG: DUF2062 domain-containing protein [Gammaproteobacteria bacterium]|nr:DUF2062 domain-containing protein [Gammaproteobacteria bacterium]
MPRHIIKRYAPDCDSIRNHKHMRMFGRLLHDPGLWHLNRRSVSGAFAIGLFWACIPIPFQMIAAAAIAIPARVNLPVSVALVWISNPVTMPPMFYFNYVLGNWILGRPPQHSGFDINMEFISESIAYVWQPLYLGSFICGLCGALLGYCAMRGLWRLHIVSYIKKRRERLQRQS